MKSGVYRIVNSGNKKQYIGSAIDLNHRWNCHVCHLRKNKHPNKRLQYAWNKYGEASFGFEIIDFVSVDVMIAEEQRLIDSAIDNGIILYNIRREARSNIGFKHSEESKRKMSKSRKGSKNHNFGKPRDPSIIKKMNDARLQLPAYNKGKKMSEEHKKKLSKARTGMKIGPMKEETKNKISQTRQGILPWNKGIKFSRLKNKTT